MDLPMDRRRFVTAAALTAGAAALPAAVFARPAGAAVPPQVTLPERGIYDTAPAADWTHGFLTGNGEYGAVALPGVLAEAIVYTRPGIVELLPALPDQLARGSITGVRGRNRVRVDSLGWDLAARTATVTLTSAVTQNITLISRRGMASVSTSAPVASSPSGRTPA